MDEMTIQGLIGQKLGMSQIFSDKGKLVPVTVIAAGPCRVVQKKTKERDGYEAVQLSFKEVPEKKLTRAERGHFKKANVPMAGHLREFKGDLNALEIGTVIGADQFQKGERVDVTGISKGKGFAGVIKLHHFAGGPATHGSMFHREPGSIGSSSYPSRVRKNKRLPAHMGDERVTIQGLEVVEVRKDENLLFVRGAIPGSRGGLVLIRRSTRK
jgi:large subunit ribosomal protein L3